MDEIFDDCANRLLRRLFCKGGDNKHNILLGILVLELHLYENEFDGLFNTSPTERWKNICDVILNNDK